MKLFKKRSIFTCSLSLSLLISGAVLITSQQKSVSNPPSVQTEIPTISWQNTRLPDWNQITFSKMPAITESGSFQVPVNVSQKLGYDPSRSWDTGQKPDSFTMLGDFQDSFKLQEFSLLDISQITGSDIQGSDLSRFGVVKFQTIESLVKAIPDLEEWKIGDVKPIYDLLSENLSQSFNANQTISNLLTKSSHLGKLNFESLDLASYNIDSIPGLSTTPIASFDKWQGVYIDEVPGLSDVPFSQFPNPANPVGMQVGIVDVAFATDEQKRNRTISGSNKEGFAVPCDKDCAHIELSGSQAVHGKAWVSGKYQLVKGGRGILGSVNGGKEPTGRNLFGDAFKVAVWDVSEVDGKVSQSLFFRVCMRNNFVDLGCTPYFIGPVPFMTYREKEPIFLGRIDSKKNSVSVSTGLKSSGFSFNSSPIISSSKKNNVSDLIPVKQGDCRNVHSSGANLDALSSALLNIENNKETQNLSSNEQQSSIESEISNLLSITSQQTDPSTGKPFSGDRLIERASQIHFAGVNIPIDSQVSDVSKGVTVIEYGKKTSAKYKQKLQTMNCFSE